MKNAKQQTDNHQQITLLNDPFAIGVSAVTVCFIAAGTFVVGSQRGDLVPKESTQEILYKGSSIWGNHLYVSGSSLKPGKDYRLEEGILTIDGNVPENSSLTVNEGRIEVNGSIGEGVFLKANVPVATKTENHKSIKYDPMARYNARTHFNPLAGYGISLDSSDETIELGPLYPQDERPAIRITGDVGNRGTLEANYNAQVGGCVNKNARMSIKRNKYTPRQCTN